MHDSTLQENAKVGIKILQRNLAWQRYNDKWINHWLTRKDHQNKNNSTPDWARQEWQTIDGHHQCTTLDTNYTNRSVTTNDVDTSNPSIHRGTSNNRNTDSGGHSTDSSTATTASRHKYNRSTRHNCWSTNGHSTCQPIQETSIANAKETTSRWDHTRQWAKTTENNWAATSITETSDTRTTNSKDENQCRDSDNKERWDNHNNILWRWTRGRNKEDPSWTNGSQYRRTGQEEDNRRNETRDWTNEETRCFNRSKHQWSHTRTTSNNHWIKMGVERQRRQGKSKNSCQRIHWTNRGCGYNLRKHTNFLHTSYPANNSNGPTMDYQSRWHFSGISTCQCSNKRFVHVASTRILQQHLANSLEVTQSHVRIEKLSLRMAKPPGTNSTRSQNDKAEEWTKRLQDKQWNSIHFSVCRRFTLHWTRWHCQWIVFSNTKAQKQLMLRPTGELSMEQTISFLGRDITNKGGHYEINLNKSYITTILEEAGMTTCKAATTPGTAANKTSNDNNDNIPVDKDEHALYRRIVGKLQWTTYTRPDLSFSTKELARSLQQPTYLDMKKMKHTLRYLQGTKDYKFILHPTTIPGNKDIPTLDVFVNADWAGCTTTRKSTTGFAIKYLGATIHFGSRTQAIVALSSAESELYSIGTGAQEAVHIRNFLVEKILTRKLKSESTRTQQVAKALQQESDLQRKQNTLIWSTSSYNSWYTMAY